MKQYGSRCSNCRQSIVMRLVKNGRWFPFEGPRESDKFHGCYHKARVSWFGRHTRKRVQRSAWPKGWKWYGFTQILKGLRA